MPMYNMVPIPVALEEFGEREVSYFFDDLVMIV